MNNKEHVQALDALRLIEREIANDLGNPNPKTQRTAQSQAEAIEYLTDFYEMLCRHGAIDHAKSMEAIKELSTYLEGTRLFGNKFHNEAI